MNWDSGPVSRKYRLQTGYKMQARYKRQIADCTLQWATKVVETLLGNDAFRYFSICSILFASSVKSSPPIQCCVGAVVCAVKEIEKSTSFCGEGGACDQDAQKFNFIIKCLNTFVAHCRVKMETDKTVFLSNT